MFDFPSFCTPRSPMIYSINYSTKTFPSFLDLLTFFSADFFVEIGGSLKYFFNSAHSKPSTQSNSRRSKSMLLPNYKSMNFDQAFGVQSKRYPATAAAASSDPSDERIHLAPYP